MVWHEGNAYSIYCCLHHQRLFTQRNRSGYVDPFHNALALKFPSIDCSTVIPETDAIVAMQILRNDWISAALDVFGRRNCSEAHIARYRMSTMSFGTATAKRMPASKPSATISLSLPSLTTSRWTLGYSRRKRASTGRNTKWIAGDASILKRSWYRQRAIPRQSALTGK